MAVRTNQLWAHGSIAGPSTVNVFSCPAGRTVIIKDLVMAAVGSGTSDVLVNVRTATGHTVTVWRAVVAGATVAVERSRFIVLEPGDQVDIVSLQSGPTIRTIASGAMLDGPPQ